MITQIAEAMVFWVAPVFFFAFIVFMVYRLAIEAPNEKGGTRVTSTPGAAAVIQHVDSVDLSNLQNSVTAIGTEFSALKHQFLELAKTAENGLANLRGTQGILNSRIDSITARTDELERRLADMEGRIPRVLPPMLISYLKSFERGLDKLYMTDAGVIDSPTIEVDYFGTSRGPIPVSSLSADHQLAPVIQFPLTITKP